MLKIDQKTLHLLSLSLFHVRRCAVQIKRLRYVSIGKHVIPLILWSIWSARVLNNFQFFERSHSHYSIFLSIRTISHYTSIWFAICGWCMSILMNIKRVLDNLSILTSDYCYHRCCCCSIITIQFCAVNVFLFFASKHNVFK